jgi:opacity protein-like surface antigen
VELTVSVRRLKRFGMAAVACISAAVTAQAADLVTKAPALETPLPAVDGINGKVDAFGGSLAHHSFYGGTGSFSVPLGPQFGFQADGMAASYRGDFLDGVAGHGFWRDPSKGLIGVYGDYLRWDRLGGVKSGTLAPSGPPISTGSRSRVSSASSPATTDRR